MPDLVRIPAHAMWTVILAVKMVSDGFRSILRLILEVVRIKVPVSVEFQSCSGFPSDPSSRYVSQVLIKILSDAGFWFPVCRIAISL